MVSDDVPGFLSKLFGPKYSVEDFYTVESIWNNVISDKDFPYKDKIKDILLSFAHGFVEQSKHIAEQDRVDFPQEMVVFAAENGFGPELQEILFPVSGNNRISSAFFSCVLFKQIKNFFMSKLYVTDNRRPQVDFRRAPRGYPHQRIRVL